MLRKVQYLKISKTHVKPLTVVILKEENFLSLALSQQSLSVSTPDAGIHGYR